MECMEREVNGVGRCAASGLDQCTLFGHMGPIDSLY